MKVLSALTVIAIAVAGSAPAEGKCATGPKSKWQPKSALELQSLPATTQSRLPPTLSALDVSHTRTWVVEGAKERIG